MGQLYLRDKITNTLYLYDKVKYSILGGGKIMFQTINIGEIIKCDVCEINCIDEFLNRYERFDIVAYKY